MMKTKNGWRFLVACACSTLLACTGGAETIQLLQNQAPAKGCIVSPMVGGDSLSRGIIDVNASGGYLFTPLVQNLAKNDGSTERSVFLNGANVDLSFQNDDLFSDGELSMLSESGFTKFRQDFSGNIPPGNFAAFKFSIVPKGLLEELAKKIPVGKKEEIFVKVEILGTLNGSKVNSNTFSYPISVCNGCLSNVVGNCVDLPADFNSNGGGACQLLQDGNLDCCKKADMSLQCPASGSGGGSGGGGGGGGGGQDS